MMELVDMLDLGSNVEIRVGSSPTVGTIKSKLLLNQLTNKLILIIMEKDKIFFGENDITYISKLPC